MTQALKGRRGPVFSVRVTSEERTALERLQARGGPRALGPWLVWRALHTQVLPGQVPILVVPEQLAGEVVPELASEVLPRPGASSGTTGLRPPAVVPTRSRLILDLCAGSGAWSAPYERAGYRVERVTLPARDVRTYVPPGEAWGIVAAPPCDQFSLARNGQPSERDIFRGMEIVAACMRVILQARPRWWALENPVGLLSRYLGSPRDTFEPCDFGDPWTKRTALWGSFVRPRRGPHVEPVGGGPLCTVCDPVRRRTTWCSKAEHRAVTPPGFARAFFEANP